MTVYYNEIDAHCAAWLRSLMDAGHIPAGDIDTRSIEDVRPDDLRGYTQCHFFAGIGGWPLALALAGWPSSEPVWTGSCPCQPFSAAGKGAGFADQRHLWPAWFHLIAQCRPPVVFGEQVASKAVDPWIDLVHADLENVDYAFGSVPFPAAGVGTPHIRDRTYWVADTTDQRLNWRRPSETSHGRDAAWVESQRLRHADGMAVPDGNGRATAPLSAVPHAEHNAQPRGNTFGVANANRRERDGFAVVRGNERYGTDAGRAKGLSGAATRGEDGSEWTGPTNGLWRDADWLLGRDGKWRPVEPGTSPLAHGIPGRVGRLRAYGNAIVPQVAAEFIGAYIDARGLIADRREVAA